MRSVLTGSPRRGRPDPGRNARALRPATIGRRLVPALVAAALFCSAPTPARDRKTPRAEKEPEPAFQVVLEAEQTEFSVDDAVMLTATLKNNSDQDMVVDAALLGARGQYEVLTPDARQVVDTGAWEPDRGKDFDAHRVPLRAHGRLTRFVSLTPHLGELLRSEGTIRIFLEFCDPALGGDADKPRCAASNAVIIRIRGNPGIRVR